MEMPFFMDEYINAHMKASKVNDHTLRKFGYTKEINVTNRTVDDLIA